MQGAETPHGEPTTTTPRLPTQPPGNGMEPPRGRSPPNLRWDGVGRQLTAQLVPPLEWLTPPPPHAARTMPPLDGHRQNDQDEATTKSLPDREHDQQSHEKESSRKNLPMKKQQLYYVPLSPVHSRSLYLAARGQGI